MPEGHEQPEVSEADDTDEAPGMAGVTGANGARGGSEGRAAASIFLRAGRILSARPYSKMTVKTSTTIPLSSIPYPSCQSQLLLSKATDTASPIPGWTMTKLEEKPPQTSMSFSRRKTDSCIGP